jgi:ansamitocin polyketide synthase A
VNYHTRIFIFVCAKKVHYIFSGCMTDDYKFQAAEYNAICNTYTVTGTHNSIISAIVSYAYHLTGPAVTLDTACSYSLVAVDIASQALQTGTVYILVS